ncbi:beta-lactamase domain protein [Catenulispora acidiphila DSM 44928]|uniref:Beta-lactamase domain protein n=1 Tax=Catenulispora acidiphila (strain DSM 44928 / JCM 14897 / NBRC 102108 / NRRL B-24433 / ID139908) TaxID=479433 RepID=C7QB04_CATAD|nr:MBL fold metallo-hydrolase [Catenulispora acidiphila]ACU74477.1 beta-lactamase domain protein [Catenulispora acidiphila DSM 44928]
MTYHGIVHAGGPPAVHELAQLIVTKIAVGPHAANCYLLRDRLTGEQLLIDAADDAPVLIQLVNGDLAAVITTHPHRDHWRALAEVAAATGAATMAGTHDTGAIEVPTTVPLADGDKIPLGRSHLTAMHLAGDTPGALALLYDDPKGHPHLFTGDCLTGAEPHAPKPAELLTGALAALPDETWVYPARGNDSTLGAERGGLGV